MLSRTFSSSSSSSSYGTRSKHSLSSLLLPLSHSSPLSSSCSYLLPPLPFPSTHYLPPSVSVSVRLRYNHSIPFRSSALFRLVSFFYFTSPQNPQSTVHNPDLVRTSKHACVPICLSVYISTHLFIYLKRSSSPLSLKCSAVHRTAVIP